MPSLVQARVLVQSLAGAPAKKGELASEALFMTGKPRLEIDLSKATPPLALRIL